MTDVVVLNQMMIAIDQHSLADIRRGSSTATIRKRIALDIPKTCACEVEWFGDHCAAAARLHDVIGNEPVGSIACDRHARCGRGGRNVRNMESYDLSVGIQSDTPDQTDR